MPESTRIGKPGEGKAPIEVHLKKSVEITREIVNQIPQLPAPEPWVVLMRNLKTGKWLNAKTFDSFVEADEMFVKMCGNKDIGAGRLRIGPQKEKHKRHIGR